MCLIALAWQADRRFPLVVAANRDEYFARPAASADWTPDGRALSGRDLRSGGTWLGVTRDGRFAALTNHRDRAAYRSGRPSRGELVDRFLGAGDPRTELLAIAADRTRFNGFNLLAGCWDPSSADGLAMSVVSQPGPAHAVPVTPGVHALSNAFLDTPWPKSEAIKAGLAAALAEGLGRDALIERLFALLSDDRVADDDRLPVTGAPVEFERAASAAFIRLPDYGTRASTVLVVDDAREAVFVERRCEPDAPIEDRRYVFATASTRFVESPLSAARAS